MGGRSKSSGGSSVPKASASGAMGMYDKMLGGQLGTIGNALGGLVDKGMQFMEDNPGKANFIRAIGGMPIQLDTPDTEKGLTARLPWKKDQLDTFCRRFEKSRLGSVRSGNRCKRC